jgi:hypothetical protein
LHARAHTLTFTPRSTVQLVQRRRKDWHSTHYGQQAKKNQEINIDVTNLSDHNSFAVLGVENIATIASGMHVVIPPNNFDKIDAIKGLEMARHALHEKQKVPIPDIEVTDLVNIENKLDSVPLLEWRDDDSENKKIIVLHSRRRRRRNKLNYY